jgi:hypothetical protein
MIHEIDHFFKDPDGQDSLLKILAVMFGVFLLIWWAGLAAWICSGMLRRWPRPLILTGVRWAPHWRNPFCIPFWFFLWPAVVIFGIEFWVRKKCGKSV